MHEAAIGQFQDLAMKPEGQEPCVPCGFNTVTSHFWGSVQGPGDNTCPPPLGWRDTLTTHAQGEQGRCSRGLTLLGLVLVHVGLIDGLLDLIKPQRLGCALGILGTAAGTETTVSGPHGGQLLLCFSSCLSHHTSQAVTSSTVATTAETPQPLHSA